MSTVLRAENNKYIPYCIHIEVFQFECIKIYRHISNFISGNFGITKSTVTVVPIPIPMPLPFHCCISHHPDFVVSCSF